MVPSATWHFAVIFSAYLLLKILLPGKEYFDVFVQTTSAIIADVNDNTLTVIVATHDFAIDIAERVIAHRWDMYVTELTIRELIYHFGTLLNPTSFEEVSFTPHTDRLDAL